MMLCEILNVSHYCVSGPTNEEVFKRLESAVDDGRMTVTLTEDHNTYVASSIG